MLVASAVVGVACCRGGARTGHGKRNGSGFRLVFEVQGYELKVQG